MNEQGPSRLIRDSVAHRQCLGARLCLAVAHKILSCLAFLRFFLQAA